MKTIVELLEGKRHGKQVKRDALSGAYSAGEILPDGFDSWEEVDNAITNLSNEIMDLDDIIYTLFHMSD